MFSTWKKKRNERKLLSSNSKAIKKVTNLKRAEILRSNEVYSNTCIIDVPKIWSTNYKITKRYLFGFRVYLKVCGDNSLWVTIFFHTWKCIVK